MKKMQELIEERTAQLKAHEAGHRRLSDEVGKIQVFKFSFLHTEWKYWMELNLMNFVFLFILFQDHERFTRQIKAFKRKIDQVNSMTDEVGCGSLFFGGSTPIF